MTGTRIEPRTVVTLKDFYGLMAETRTLRAEIVEALMKSTSLPDDCIDQLGFALRSLRDIPGEGTSKKLKVDASKTIEADLAYEINELGKDIDYLSNGEEAFLKSLEALHPNFETYVKAGTDKLGGKHFNTFITDRDGTTNNYCGRYISSVQSVYNAVFLARFCCAKADNPIMLTSAPLSDPGLTDVSVLPDKTMIYAASKGREFIDLNGIRRHFSIEPDKQALLNTFHTQLAELLRQPEYEKYGLIGSGLQYKFGQITVARQDISGSATDVESEAFLETVRALVRKLDPDGTNFRIEDTGLDIEIILTIGDADSGLKDFDKGDGVKYLDSELNMNMASGPHLICGDTGSDVPMLTAALEYTEDTFSIFVTKKPELGDRVRSLCPNAVIVPEPDMLVAILNTLSETA